MPDSERSFAALYFTKRIGGIFDGTCLQKQLRRFNLVMGFLHLIQGVAMIFLATTVIQKIAQFSPTITQNYLAFNPETQSLEAASKALFQLPFGVLVGVFLLLSALAHALISIPNRLNVVYNRDLAKGINKFRWFEYALSSSVMIVLIATLFASMISPLWF